jgi:predicted MFS family arabinose efflux permease
MANAERTRPPSGFAVGLAGYCSFLGLYATQPLLPMFADIFHASQVRVSLTVTAATVAVAIAAPFIGRLADRLGRKRVIVWCAFLIGLATLAAATAPNLEALIGWRFLQGVFTPGIFAVTIAYIHEEWAANATGGATASYVTGTVLGGFSGRVLMGFVASHLGWQFAFVVLGALHVAGAVALRVWLPQERKQSAGKGLEPARHAVIDHLTNRPLAATYALGFCVLFSLQAIFTYVTFYLADPPFHLQPAALGSIFAVYLVGAAITPACGRAIDRYGNRMALVVAVTSGIGGVLLTLWPVLGSVLVGLTLCSSGVFIAQASASSYIGIAAERNRALAVGLYVSFYYMGGSAGAAIPGLVWKGGGWPACVALVVMVQVITIVIALNAWRDRKPAEVDAAEILP